MPTLRMAAVMAAIAYFLCAIIDRHPTALPVASRDLGRTMLQHIVKEFRL